MMNSTATGWIREVTYRIDTRFWSAQRAENVSVADGYCVWLEKGKARRVRLHAGGVISRETFQYGYYEPVPLPAGAGWHTSFWMMRHNGRRAADEAAQCRKSTCASRIR